MKRRITTPTLLMFIAAIAMMLVSAVGITRAALTETETYDSQIDMKNIGVILQENGLEVEGDNLLFEFARGDYGKFKIGVTYPELITVQNSGDIDEYVRVIVRKYWCDNTDGGSKNNELDPKYIELVFNEEDWIKDENASTDEREVFYYKKILKPGTDTASAEISAPLITDLRISTEVKQIVDIQMVDGKPYGTYAYDGKWFGLDVEVDAVQTHHAQDAIKSAWGVDATVDEAAGTLTEVKS